MADRRTLAELKRVFNLNHILPPQLSAASSHTFARSPRICSDCHSAIDSHILLKMNFQTFSLSSKGVPSGSKPSQRVASGPVGWLADHQPQPSAGLERAEKEDAPPCENTMQPSGAVATNTLRAPVIDSDGAGEVMATSHYKSSSKRKVAHPAPLVQPPPSQSSPPSWKAVAPPPVKVTGKRGSPSQEPAGPSSPSKRARIVKEKEIRVDVATATESTPETKSTLAVPHPVPVRSLTPPPQPTPREATNPDLVPDPGNVAPTLRTRQQYKVASQYPLPNENGDITTHYSLSDRPNARGGRDKRADATMAMRIAEVQSLKARYEYLVNRLHSEERMADPAADDAFEDDLAEAAAANKAWRDAEQDLCSPSVTLSPKKPRLAPMSLPVPTPVSSENDTPIMIQGMRKQYNVLLQYLDHLLPELPPTSANGSDVEAQVRELSEVLNPRTRRTRRSRLPPSTKAAPPDSQDSGESPPASRTAPVAVRLQHLAPSSEGNLPSTSLATPTNPTTANAVASTSGATATIPFRFSASNEARLLEHAGEQKYQAAIGMIPANQQRLVLRRPAEIAAVRLIHAKPKTRPTNNGTRKVKTHIGEDGVETELWVCRALFKVHKGCGGIDYLESPCGYPVGTKDSWIRHLKDVHLGRVNRGA